MFPQKITYENEQELKYLKAVKCNIYEIAYRMNVLKFLKTNYFSELILGLNSSINIHQCIKILFELISTKTSIIVTI